MDVFVVVVLAIVDGLIILAMLLQHWAPNIGKVNNDNDYVDNDVGEEEDCDQMEVVAGTADPVRRKEKKGLDFSRWQEIVKNDGKSGTRETRKELHSTGLGVVHKAKEINPSKISRQIADPDENVIPPRQWPQNDTAQSDGSTTLEKLPKWENGSSKDIQEDLKKKSTQKYWVASGFAAQKLVGGEEDNLENQIDAENRARLAKMSADEIVEAQADIKARFNPELINALKRRSQTKVKRQKFSLSDVTYSEADSLQHEKNGSKLTESYANTTTDEPVKVVPGDTLQEKDGKASSNISIENRGKWDSWSRRVESVREMRFSLDGDIVFAHVSDTGKAAKLAHNLLQLFETLMHDICRFGC